MSFLNRILLILRRSENALLVSALALIMVLPMAEAVCRLFGVGISGAQPMIQHITLIIAMVGGAIAARESRLLSISTLTAFLKEPVKIWSNLFAGAFAVMITCVLCVASYQFVMSERPMADILAYNIPKWWVQLVMPIGFGLITLRLWWRSGNNWMMRALSLILSAALLWIFYIPFCEPSHLFWPFRILLLVATVLGAPLYVTLGGAAVMLFWSEGSTVDALPVDQYGLVTNPTLPTLPLFTLAGYFLAEGGASKRLIRVFTALVGSIRGGTVIMTFWSALSSPLLPEPPESPFWLWADSSCRSCWLPNTVRRIRWALLRAPELWACSSRPACRSSFTPLLPATSRSSRCSSEGSSPASSCLRS
jgi:TRAP-type C4-dicarboxylate transport system permease small subunit